MYERVGVCVLGKPTLFPKASGTAIALLLAPLGTAFLLGAPSARASTAELLHECLHASNPDERAEACTSVLGETRDQATIVRALNGRGNALCATRERCVEAVQDFAAVVKLVPTVAGYFDNYARALRAAERYDDATAASERAIGLAPRAAFTYAGKAATQEAAGKFADALATIERGIAVLPAEAWLWEVRGTLLGRLGKFAEAYAAFAHSLELQPSRIGVQIRRADIEIAEERYDAAEKDLTDYPSSGAEAGDARGRLAVLQALRPRLASMNSAAAKASAAGVTTPPTTARAPAPSEPNLGSIDPPLPSSQTSPQPDPAPSPSTTSEIDACDAPGALAVVRHLSEQALKEQAFQLLLANVQEAHFEYVGIRQVSFDAENEHRVCAMDRKLVMTFYPHVQRAPAREPAPITYQVDRQLDGNRGSYITCECGKGL